MKKNGFISMTMLYSFFILFILLMTILLSSYSTHRVLKKEYTNKVEQNVLGDINIVLKLKNSEGKYETVDSINTDNLSLEKGYCEDANQEKILNGLEYKNDKISTNISKNANFPVTCYAYFEEYTGDSDEQSSVSDKFEPIQLVTEDDPHDRRGQDGLSTDDTTTGMYRYQGTNDTVNNYICIGNDECTFTDSVISDNMSESDLAASENMYRIIGIASDGRMKVIKMGLSSSKHNNGNRDNSNVLKWSWGDGATISYDWSNAIPKTSLNDTSTDFYLDLLGDYVKYIDSSSSSKFYSTATIGKSKPAYISAIDTSATSLYNEEITKTLYSANKSEYKVGLMQLSDYYLAVSNDVNCSSDYATCASSWIHLSKNDSRSSGEWTIARADANYAWIVKTSDGSVFKNTLYLQYGVRPVFYLKPNIYLKGSGTKDSPYYIVGDYKVGESDE